MISARTIRFAGYAGLFDLADGDHDVIRRGAFAASLEQQDRPFPLLWQHRPDQPIGEIERIAEDERGLRVIARIDRLASRAAYLIREGKVNGLSFGYRAREARRSRSGRELLRIELFEISLVTHPLQHGARVHLIV